MAVEAVGEIGRDQGVVVVSSPPSEAGELQTRYIALRGQQKQALEDTVRIIVIKTLDKDKLLYLMVVEAVGVAGGDQGAVHVAASSSQPSEA